MMGGQKMSKSDADQYVQRFVFYNLDAREVKRRHAEGYSDATIKGAANIALRSGRSLDYILRRVTVSGEPLPLIASQLGVPTTAMNADIPGYGNGTINLESRGAMSGAATDPSLSNPDLGVALATPVTNNAGPQTPPPDDLRTITPDEQAAFDRAAQQTLGRADAQMRAVLQAFQTLNPVPLFTLTPEEARRRPTIADAVRTVQTQRNLPTTPEPVGNVRDTTITGPAGPVPVRVYTPAGTGPFPAIVYFHGGGFVFATIDTYDASCRALANAAQAVVISVEYRKAPENKLPAAHEDGYAVLQYVMNNGAEFGAEGTRVAVAGESAGGNLAADLCLLARARNGKMPVYQLLVYPIADGRSNRPSDRENRNAIALSAPLVDWFNFYIVPNPAFGQIPLVELGDRAPTAPVNGVALPPATVVLAELDPLRSEGQAYAERLQRGGVPVRTRVFSGVSHEFFGTGVVVDKGKQAVAFAAEGLRAAFKPANR